jgi:carotenoid cleavage dioxygenase-like enzyme
MYAICGDVNPTGDNHLILYKISPENVRKRIAVATVSTGKTPLYEHSIGFDGKYATIFAHPVSFDMTKQVLGYPLTECLTFDKTKNTKIHVINTEDGSVKTADTKFNFQMMHTGNQYIKDNKIIIDATIYTIDTKDIFGSLTFSNMQK